MCSWCEGYWGIAFGLQITAANHSKCTLILYYINESRHRSRRRSWGNCLPGVVGSMEQDKRGWRWPGLISALRYNLCALICNSITQASRPIGGATVATLRQLVLTAHYSVLSALLPRSIMLISLCVRVSVCVCFVETVRLEDSQPVSRQDSIRPTSVARCPSTVAVDIV